MLAWPRLLAAASLALAPLAAAHGDLILHGHAVDALGHIDGWTGPAHADPRQCTSAVRNLSPRGGPFTGGTAVTVFGAAFVDLGDAKCRFGVDEVQARVVNGSLIECSSPGCTSPTCVSGQEETAVSVPLEVSMNGVSFSGSGLQYTYYDMRHVYVSLITPAGGPTAGETRVLLNGAGFRDFPSLALTGTRSGVPPGVRMHGIKCKYGQNEMVNATRIDRSSAVCLAPDDATFPGGEEVQQSHGKSATPPAICSQDATACSHGKATHIV